MGLFSGGFLGSGSDESSTHTTTQTTVTTETTTQVHDIGITGQNAVDLTNVLTGNVGHVLETISNNDAKVQLGSLQLVQNIQAQGEQLLSDIGSRQETSQQQLLTTYKETTNPALVLAEGQQKLVLLGMLAIAAFFVLGRRL